MNMITVDYHQHANEDFSTIDDKVFNKNTSTKQEGLWTHSNELLLTNLVGVSYVSRGPPANGLHSRDAMPCTPSYTTCVTYVPKNI